MKRLILLIGVLSLTVQAVDFRAEMAMTVTQKGQAAVRVKAGDTFSLVKKDAALLEAPGHVPILVVPVGPSAERVGVRLKSWRESNSAPSHWWESMDQLIEGIVKVQRLMRDKKPSEALALASSLESEFPRIAQLKLLKASCHYMLGNRTSVQKKPSATSSEPSENNGLEEEQSDEP